MNSIVFASLKNTFDKNPENHEMPLEQFVEFVCNTAKRLSVDPNWTKAEYDAAKIKQRAIAPVGGRRKDATLESSFVPFDFDHLTREQYRTVVRTFKSAPFFNIMHTTASDGHACKNGDRALRVLIPTATVFTTDDTWMIQRVIMDELGIDGKLRDTCTDDPNRLLYLPHRESKITVTEGRLLRPRRYIARGEEMGLAKRERKELVADEHGLNADIAYFCEAELGLDALSSGRGYEVPCPNEHLHTGKGSTSIMLDGKEVRFVCQHTNNGACTELNRRQHLALRMCGLPDELNVDKQPISINSIRAALPDLPDEEIEELHRTENGESVTCSLDDLEDDEVAELPMPAQPRYIVNGYITPSSVGAFVGESGTYKSFLALSIMYITAAGYDFAGARTSRAHHFYIDGEGGAATHGRIDALAKTYGEEGRRYVHVIDINELKSPDGKNVREYALRKLIKRIKETCNGEPVGMAVFDTLNQSLALLLESFDENSNNTDTGMGAVIAFLKAIKEATGAAAAIVHHTPKGGKKARGGGALYGGLDWEITASRGVQDMTLNLAHTKFKHGPQQKTFGVVLATVEFREPEPFVPSESRDFGDYNASVGASQSITEYKTNEALVVYPAAYVPFPEQGGPSASDREDRRDNAMKEIGSYLEETTSCEEDGKSLDEMAAYFQNKYPEASGWSRDSVQRKINDLAKLCDTAEWDERGNLISATLPDTNKRLVRGKRDKKYVFYME